MVSAGLDELARQAKTVTSHPQVETALPMSSNHAFRRRSDIASELRGTGVTFQINYAQGMKERLSGQTIIEMWSSVQFRKCVPLIKRVEAAARARDGLAFPDSGSPLAEDDLSLKPICRAIKIDSLATTAKWAALMAETQLISAWPAEPEEDSGYREVAFSPYAGFTLVRGSMEASSYALWLLNPDDSETRLKRFASLTIENQRKYREAINAWQLSESTDVTDAEVASPAEVENEFEAAGITPPRYPGSTALIKKAGRCIPSATLRWPPIVAWQVASAVAHGLPWSRREAAKTFYDQTTGKATVKIDAESFRFVLQAATVMFEALVSRIEELQTTLRAAPNSGI